MSELSKVDIYRQIDVLRQSLLDLTMRNQLLNFRTRTMTVEVKEGELSEIYDRLVLKKAKENCYSLSQNRNRVFYKYRAGR